MEALKPKKKTKVDPGDTELDDLGPPPSTEDLRHLFVSDDTTNRHESSNAAFTEDTLLNDSRTTSNAGFHNKEAEEERSSRSSTPSSAAGLVRKTKRNTVAPIHEETSFGVNNDTFEEDEEAVVKPAIEAWSESGSVVSARPQTAPSKEETSSKENLSRPSTAPSRGNIFRGNRVTPSSTLASSPVPSERTVTPTIFQSPITGDTVSPKNSSEDEATKQSLSMSSIEKDSTSTPMENVGSVEKHLNEDVIQEESSLVSYEAVLAPPEATGEHQAYVPMDYARDCIQKVIEDMKKMKANHYKVVEKIQEQYQLIEEESQVQFKEYVMKLRGEYSSKVATFKHVLQSHTDDFTKKQKFYEDAIKSLRDKNKSLLFEKKQLLVKAKETNEKHKKEKKQIMEDLVKMLDTKHKEYIVLREKFEEKRDQKQQCDEEIYDLKQKLDLSKGEKDKVSIDIDTLTQKNDELKQQIDFIESEKSKLNDSCSEKDNLLSKNNEDIGNKDQLIKDLQEKIAQLEAKLQDTRASIKPVVAAEYTVSKEQYSTESTQESSPIHIDHAVEETVVNEEIVSQSTPSVQSSSEDVMKLRKQIEDQEKLSKESNEKIKSLQVEIDALKTSLQDEKNEKNIVKMELINMQEKNAVLHARLETMLNEVVDSVNIDQTNNKLNELNQKKSQIESEIDDIKKKIDAWKDDYSKEHGEEPKDDDRPDDIEDLYNEMKGKEENKAAVEKDILVLNMLLDGTLPDDMKQQENADNPKDKALEEMERKHSEEKAHLNDLIQMFKERAEFLSTQKEELENKLHAKEKEKNEGDISVGVNEQVDDEASKERIKELTDKLQEADNNLALIEKEKDEEIDGVKKSLHKTEKKLSKAQSAIESKERELRDLKSELKVKEETAEADIKLKQETTDKLQSELDKLNEEKLAKFPVKAKAEIKSLQEKLKEAEANKSGKDEETLQLQSKINELQEQVNNNTITIDALKKKEEELKTLQDTEKKYKELKKKYKALEAKKTVTKTVVSPSSSPSKSPSDDTARVKELEKKIADLEKQLLDTPAVPSKDSAPSKKDGKADPKALLKLEKANELLKEKMEGLKKSAQSDAEKIKELEQKIKELKSKGDDKNAKKQEKAMKDLQKKLESETKKTAKLKEDLEKEKSETERLTKELDSADGDRKKLREEINKLGVAAQEGLEALEKVKELTKSNKSLTEENKQLAENFNSERILRKKYYNMVEDMKGKIRVYCRARPLSRSELDRGNHNIISSPDEYTLIVQTPRGPKDFQYDAVFTPDHSQEKVFEDTNNLIQSAVDGYNVCIFAYGQTGSGKTFTMIGDKEQKFPGIAPRAFDAIYRLIDENKSKFSFKTYMYMLELYRDNLIDLFGDQKNPAKLDIKKDKKGMVQVVGSVVQEASSSEELMQIFERGSANRHVASTKMNAESSRSHLVLSIIIESTNLTSGSVVKGKLSLVDLAGSERAAKTGATAEQLKEAQSINKSLSALGDVISALSSEQSFIPYRNNKLTLLMQDSLGGNAKTLMFVNISPADYNADETVTSLTYASRVKLITNDASKNADNKEIARLKGIISKLKKGEKVDEEDE